MTLERLDRPAEAAERCAAWRAEGRSLGFVPTMGALHDGHLELVRRAREENDRAVVSVFVNPLQFDDPADLERYPRDLDGDARLLAGVGCDLVLTGTLAGFFPEVAGAEGAFPAEALEDPGPAAEGLEGEHRPGHFAGVATIVRRLFEVVRPTRAYFGRKDYQQCRVVLDLAARLGFPEVCVHPTVREADGLARSSRNLLLDEAGRREGLAISRGLFAARDAWAAGERDVARLTATLRAPLADSRLEVEYAELRDPDAWTAEAPAGRLERAVALVAARAGRVRLIDNLELHGTGS